MSLFHPQPAKADSPQFTNDNVKNAALSWVDRSHIKAVIGSKTIIFYDRDITDGGPRGDHKFNYKAQGYDTCDHAEIDLDASTNSANQYVPNLSTAHLDIDIREPGVVNGSCHNTNPNSISLPISDVAAAGCPGGPAGPPAPGTVCGGDNKNVMYVQQDASTIANVDGDSKWVFIKSSVNPNEYIQKGNDDACPNIILVTGNTYQVYQLTDNKNNRPVNSATLNLSKQCYQKYDNNTYMDMGAGLYPNKSYPLGSTAAGQGQNASSNGSGNIAGNNALCEAHGLSLAWLICPLVNGLADVFDTIFQSVVLPLLQTGAVNLDPSGNIYKVWSNFRLYGNILLIIALLVIVFGQSIGGGLVDAYTAKRMVPRIIVAAIAINLSIYLVAIAVDVTNIIGQGIYGLMTAPLSASQTFKFTVGNGSSALLGIGLGGLVGAAFIPGALGVVASAIPLLLLFVVVPAVMAALGVVVTLILRRAIIIALIIISPVAFALYCLPNTEQYFKKWWDALFKTLMVYPIVMAIIGAINIFAVTLSQANEGAGGISKFFGQLVSMIAILIPLFVIPFAFKIASGFVGSIYGAATGFRKQLGELAKGNINNPNSLRNSLKKRVTGEYTKNRAQFVRDHENNQFDTSKGRFSRYRGRAAGILARRLAYGNVRDAEAALNEEGQKIQGRTNSFGDDLYSRARTSIPLFMTEAGGYTTEQSQAMIGSNGRAVRAEDDYGNALRTSMNGQKQFTDIDYEKSRQLYRNMGAMQESVNYEAGKTSSDQDINTFENNYLRWAQQEGLTAEQATGLRTGVAFAKQNERLEMKHGGVKRNDDGSFTRMSASATGGLVVKDGKIKSVGTKITDDGSLVALGGRDAFVQELYDKKGPYLVSQMRDSTVNEVAASKNAYAEEIRNLNAKEAGGQQLSNVEATRRDLSREKLQQIQEMEATWVGKSGAGGPPISAEAMGGPEGAISSPYAGLSGAPEAVQQAANRMAMRTATMADGNTGSVRAIYDVNTGNYVAQQGEQGGPPARPTRSSGGFPSSGTFS